LAWSPCCSTFWLLLNQSLAPGHWLLGLLFAVVVAALAKRLRPLGARPKRPLLAVQLLWHVFCDIVRSNIAVSSIILGSPPAPARPALGLSRHSARPRAIPMHWPRWP